jgi:putative aldouronate transport system substrate-binding protein
MKRKKFGAIAILLCIILIFAFVAACADDNSTAPAVTPDQPPQEAPDNGSQQDTEQQDNGYWTGDVSKIVMTYLMFDAPPADLDMVVDAINQITIPRIGVEVEFMPVNLWDSFTMYSTWIATNEPIDLMVTVWQGISPYVQQGMLLPLDDLVEQYGPTIVSMRDEHLMHEAAVFNGEIFAVISPRRGYEGGGSYIIRQSALDAAGLDFYNRQKITLEDLTTIFTEVHAALPDMIPAGITGAMPPFEFTQAIDNLGDSIASGVLMGTNSAKVVNMFATPEYEHFLRTVRKWYQDGFILRDAAVTDETALTLFDAGRIAGDFAGAPNWLRLEREDRSGEPCVQLILVEPFLASRGSASNVNWIIPVTSREPEAAMRFLDLTMSDITLLNLLQWGIEGTHFARLDDEGLIEFADGLNPVTSGYFNTLGLYGNQQNAFYWNPEDAPSNQGDYMDVAWANPSRGVGFAYDNSETVTQIATIQAVIDEFRPTLETGTADVDVTLPMFLERLEAAGINEVIAHKQAQFDAWLAQQ